ncbi:MAG: hypothetical protein CMO01_00660 [Thalassobius sp.]|nr:hypothetical protein [Thalassovita sp.]
MKKYITFFILCLCWVNAWAHNTNIACYTLRDTGAGWMIEINFAQAGLLADVKRDMSNSDFAKLNNEELKSHIIEKIQRNFHLEVDGIKVPLRDGGILMGNHQTNLKFILPEIPANPQQMDVSIPMCSETYNHTNIFRIYRGGEKIPKFFLSEDNKFHVALVFSNDKVEAVDDSELYYSTKFKPVYGVVVLALLFLFSGLIKFRKKITDLWQHKVTL